MQDSKIVGNDTLAQVIVKEYDEKVMLPLFLQVYFHLNPIVALIVEVINFENDNFFGQQVSNEHVIFSTLKNKLQFYCCWYGSLVECDNFLKWWA